ncbi:uncharacterized protein LOC101448503 isoform X1 [Ceratitis capitata]|uniref:uncharacterized protein LOC101448503 isoform X1 n=1 Tax=Ceratitis capitata TaxID=7213 RepID=UPI0003297D89|nr:uncharacterized protein LOC101448503 isoform X1 [Ceratitis capitata]XP_004526219.1 uncharacterized protein LOC101448503 isoform X1 [Ceratitis capitata]
MGDNILPELGDLVFSVLIGYAGALEFLYVLRHLYHWSCSHVNAIKNDPESFKRLQERMRSELAEAEAKELQAGMAVMKDGILYKDGFRIGSEQLAQNSPENSKRRKKELELELERQREIEEETRRQLVDAEARLAEERKKAAEALAARQREEEEEATKLLAVEFARKEQQAREEEETRKIKEAERKEKEEEEERRREMHAESLKLFEAEREREKQQRKKEIEENVTESGLILIEKQQGEPNEAITEVKDGQHAPQNETLEHSKPKEYSEADTMGNIMRLLDSENERKILEKEFEETASRERSEKLRICEENARKFLEADKEMEELLESAQKIRRHSATESTPQSPVFENPCVKKSISPLSDISDSDSHRFTQTLKTQFGQTSNEPYLLKTRSLLFESKSDDTHSFDSQSALRAQPSEEYGTSSDAAIDNTIEVQFAHLERQEPDGGEDNDSRVPAKYTDDYLRSLDGIKQRPLIREDGSGRRRAFKKRRSSGSSNSSFESRTSREEEVKMFTSLEEEELLPKKLGEDDFTPITYSTEPLLRVKTPRRRHKRSPAKDAMISDGNTRSSVEMLEEETDTNPWGEITPEHYKDTPFWKREKSMSIDEEAIELELSSTKADEEADDNVRNLHTALLFENPPCSNNDEALTELQLQQAKQVQKNTEQQPADEPSSDIQPNLQFVPNAATGSPISCKAASPRLRRSPRIEEMDQYEELWNATNEPNALEEILTPTTPSTPSIILNKSPDIGPWRDQYGLLMEGISDFYDFTASINPSRSRSTSRQASPSASQPGTPVPKNVEFELCQTSEDTLDLYDDTGSALEMDKKSLVNFIESFQNESLRLPQVIKEQLQNVADTPNKTNEEIEGSPIELKLLIQTLPNKIQSRLSETVDDQIEHSNALLEAPDLKSPNIESPSNITEIRGLDDMETLVQERYVRTRSRSRSPLPTPNNLERSLETRRSKRIRQNDDLSEKLGIDIDTSGTTSHSNSPSSSPSIRCNDSMNFLELSIRTERTQSHSRSRSRSPLPTAENLKTGLEHRRQKKIQQNDELFQQLHISIPPIADDDSKLLERKCITAPVISIQCCDEECLEDSLEIPLEDSADTLESMITLVETLRLQRSRSKSPMRRLERERTPEPSKTRADIIESDQLNDREYEHEKRSCTPSRSISISPTLSNEDIDFHIMLNLESSQNRTLSKCSEEMESILAEKQRQVDAEALSKLSNASEEVELRTVTPVSPYEIGDKYKLMALPIEESLRQRRCSPTTPDYDRTISQEWSDTQRIKDTMLTTGFKRSTYVGESLDLGSEFASLREENARFQRSSSPSPSLIYVESREKANERQLEQDKILSELISVSKQVDEERMGAKPKSIDTSTRSKEIQQSEFESRSPLNEIEAKEFEQIEEEATERELQYRIADIEKANINFQEFSRYLNAGFLDNERRASDSALIQKPEIMIQLQELEEDFELEPENYHHFRRFSLNQEESVEEYPNDDYVYVSQIEVQTPSGTRTWIREDFYSENFEELSIFQEVGSANAALKLDAVNEAAEIQIPVPEDEDTDGSEDERQTIVEVDDEIDEDICDFNERGPADESHHEQSECEEADREIDHYANRDADDWQRLENIEEYLANVEGAVGGDVDVLEYDSDSAAIDEIYDDAIKNRKQSGIQRDYDNILNEMQKNYMMNAVRGNGSEADMSGMSDNDRTTVEESQKEKSLIPKLIRNERHENELRYLGDAANAERKSARLRTRYGYMPQHHHNSTEELDFEVDLNYTPKKEYNWRKNFKLDEGEINVKEKQNIPTKGETDKNETTIDEYLELRKFSLGGESITIFSQGSEGICYIANENQEVVDTKQEGTECSKFGEKLLHFEGMDEETILEKPKKKKSKKKQHRESRNNSMECYTKDQYDSESQVNSRRNSSNSTKSAKSRSRRNSRNNDEVNVGIFSPSERVLIEESNASNLISANKKKLKKRKKTKETFNNKESETKDELTKVENDNYFDLSVKVATASAAVTPDTCSINPLASLSPQDSICTPSSSIDSETSILAELISVPSSAEASPMQREVCTPPVDMATSATTDALISQSTITAPKSTKVDTFDILKDANFYPLF